MLTDSEKNSESVNASNFFVNTPICCPSRSTLISGRYTHNIKVTTTRDTGCMRMNTSRVENPNFWKNSFVSMLKTKFKYNTGIFGKMLNVMDTYGCNGTGLEDVDRSFIMCNPSFYNPTWANFTGVDGNVYTSGDSPEDYTTSMIGNTSVSWMRSVVEDEKPFFAFVGLHAPHLPSTPPPYVV